MLLEDREFMKAALKNKKSAFLKTTTRLVSSVTEVLSVVSTNLKIKRDLKETLFTAEEVKTISDDKVKNIIIEYEMFETDFSANCIELLSS